ncbi:glycosyltransferase family 2 protein [Oceanicola sp. S124]|uniref:glycosyltransferase family 2 protein n=1 Tax=Oceanicola sp. S124 TaxID=1042378 RepID=UPI0002558A20|nr:glycosyltransferase family 2 protein [Oceanicola sp. S124]
MASNLRKLDAQRSIHVGPPSSEGLDLGQAGMFREMPTAFAGQRSLPPPAELRRRWAEGEIDEPEVLALLAEQNGLELVDITKAPPDPGLQDLLDPKFCLRHQVVPWRSHDGILVCATARPEHYVEIVAPLAYRLRREMRLGLRPVIAPRAQIQAAVAAHHRNQLVQQMSSRVPASESCRTWSATRRRLAVTFGLLTLLVLASLLHPGAVLVALTGWAVMTLVLAMVLKGAAATVHLLRPAPPAPPGPLPEAELPDISILVPLFRERRIAAALLKRLQQLDYPREKLDIVLVLEEADDITRATIAGLALPHWIRTVVVPAGTPQTKPRAMNYALDFCRGEIIGIYDAEDAPDADQLRRVAARFAAAPPRTACLQGALDYYNPRQNWLARCFTVEYNTWFRLVLPGMARMGFAVPLGGTTLFLRRDVIEILGGWDAHNVTEDADLGIRLARHGFRTELLNTTTGEEANCRTLPWVKQRSRWLKGYMVTYLVHLRHPHRLHRELGAWRTIGFHAHFITAISQFLLAPLLWSFWLMLAGVPHPLLTLVPQALLTTCAVLFFCAEVQNIALGLIATRRRRHRHLWPWIPTLHLYYPLGCLAAYNALFELVVNPFYWDKTQHGLSLSPPSPSGQVTPPRPGDRSAAPDS